MHLSRTVRTKRPAYAFIRGLCGAVLTVNRPGLVDGTRYGSIGKREAVPGAVSPVYRIAAGCALSATNVGERPGVPGGVACLFRPGRLPVLPLFGLRRSSRLFPPRPSNAGSCANWGPFGDQREPAGDDRCAAANVMRDRAFATAHRCTRLTCGFALS